MYLWNSYSKKLLLAWGPNGIPGGRSTTLNELPMHPSDNGHRARALSTGPGNYQKDYVEGLSLPCTLHNSLGGVWWLSSSLGHMYLLHSKNFMQFCCTLQAG